MSATTWLPVALALAAAAFFGCAGVVSKRGMVRVEPQLGATISLGSSLVVFLASSPLWMRAEDWFGLGFWIFLVNGFFHPMLSMYCWLEAIQRAGATVASTLTATAPLFAALSSIVALGESMTALIALGTAFTVIGVVTLSWGPMRVGTAMRAALLFATGAALVRGLNHTIGKVGLELMPNAFMAAFVSCAVSFVGMLTIYRVRQGHFPRGIPRAGLGYFLLNGALMAGGISSMYAAISVGSVVVVSPLIATYPVFTMVLAFALGMERLTARLLAGVALVVGGVAAISIGMAR
ncbi:MAG: DMT family transporter [Ectothiorhodospiraceae bacterium]|nr:DMT family transporter [Ectothiorhodospiraceae bacterium]